MYPPSVLYWLGGIAVIIGGLGVFGVFVWWLDMKFEEIAERHRKDHDAPKGDEKGPGSDGTPEVEE